MMEPWNNATLLAPPIHTSKIKASFDSSELKHVCDNVIKILSKQSPLHKEGALCSRFIYKFDKKFRHDIGYRHFKKVYTALKRYLKINYLKDIENFTSALPTEQDEYYYPTRQMLEYVLVKLVTFSKIMLRMNVCAKQSAVFYLNRIKRGETHWMCLMPYALVSRIWSISKVLLQHSVQWYTNLHKYVDKLQYKGMRHLPEGYILPEDVKLWLGLEGLDNLGRFEWSEKKYTVDPTLMSNEDTDGFLNILGFVSQLNEDEIVLDKHEPPVVGIANSQQLQVPRLNSIDQGEVVCRESFNVLHNFHNKMKYSKCNHTFETVINTLSLQEFIDKEEVFRNDKNKLSLTNHLSLMQWHALKKALLNACSIVGNNKKIQRKLKKIWEEKCLDYL
ncbi:hypothetical protein K1T71_008825 [Dendrolimus kikuchii]|uniref:Uncharacterized protein n=1 Tax=Dendrolimus kikuchii TaxID=765133 RepID=A0ACC1CVE0_9NEOP|nr:hypothetical protein K1T71_008825 [Dendrolimus kikuchii]